MSKKGIIASVTLLGANDGGRSQPLLSGYRSLLRFEGSDIDFGFELELDPAANTSGLAPGNSAKARLLFWAAEELPALFAGQKFEMREGARVVGYGSVTETAETPPDPGL